MPIYTQITNQKYWEEMRNCIRRGNFSYYFQTGNLIYDNRDPNTGVAFQVVAQNAHFNQELYNAGYRNSVTLCQYNITERKDFYSLDAFIYLEKEMPPGNYYFTIPNYDSNYGGNAPYYFTTTRTIPVGGHILLNWPLNSRPRTVTSYASATSSEALDDSLALTKYVDGTSPQSENLGTLSNSSSANTSEYGILNHVVRARYGSNNYAQSGLRQYINSNSIAGQWWEPTTVFSHYYTYADEDGYLTKLDQSFVNVLTTPDITNISNNVFEYPSLDQTTYPLNTTYTLHDKMFFLSHTELGFSDTPAVGKRLDYYSPFYGYTKTKYINEGFHNNWIWYLRNPYPSDACYIRAVNSSGNLGSVYGQYRPSIATGVVPACVIQ